MAHRYVDRTKEGPATWIPTFSQLIQIYFVVVITAAFLAATLPPLRDSILTYGKLDSPSSISSANTSKKTTKFSTTLSEGHLKSSKAACLSPHGQFFATLKTFKVPKTWFAHFYIFATLWMVYLSLDLYLYTSSSQSSPIFKFYPVTTRIVPKFLTSTFPFWSFLTGLTKLGIMSSPNHSTVEPGSTADSSESSLVISSSASWTPPVEILLVMSCYLIHVLRRWYESWFVERPSKEAQIHVGHYLIGISFYAAMAPAFWVDSMEAWTRSSPEQKNIYLQEEEGGGALEMLWSVSGWCWVGLALFLWGSLHQYRCHVILANLRSKPRLEMVAGTGTGAGGGGVVGETLQQQEQTKQDYMVPFGDWFQYMVTPHYSAEMVIYLGFYLMASSTSFSSTNARVKSLRAEGEARSGLTLLFAFVWVVVNLGIVARETDQWYRTRFGENYADMAAGPEADRQRQRKKRWIVVPYVY